MIPKKSLTDTLGASDSDLISLSSLNLNLFSFPSRNLDFDFNDIEAHYLNNMPPITDTLGKGHLDFQMFTIDLFDGRIDLEEGQEFILIMVSLMHLILKKDMVLGKL